MATEAAQRENTVVTATFPKDLAARLAERARVNDRSVSAELRRAAIRHLEHAEREPADA